MENLDELFETLGESLADECQRLNFLVQNEYYIEDIEERTRMIDAVEVLEIFFSDTDNLKRLVQMAQDETFLNRK